MTELAYTGDFCPNKECPEYGKMQNPGQRNIIKYGFTRSRRQRYRSETCKLSIWPEYVTLMTDEHMLNQVLSNLLRNASKFTPNGGEFGIEAAGDQAAGNIAISVWDNGIGISKDNTTRLFQPFVQLDSSLARHFKGTGLGLALVKLKVDLLGGSVTVTSQIGLGSRFTVILPWQ
jgi:signal transduction histidine kinase